MQLAGRCSGPFAGKQFHLSLSKNYFSQKSIHPAAFLVFAIHLLYVKFTYFLPKFRRKQKSHKGGGGIFCQFALAGRGFASPSPPLQKSSPATYFNKVSLKLLTLSGNGRRDQGKCTVTGMRAMFKSLVAGSGLEGRATNYDLKISAGRAPLLARNELYMNYCPCKRGRTSKLSRNLRLKSNQNYSIERNENGSNPIEVVPEFAETNASNSKRFARQAKHFIVRSTEVERANHPRGWGAKSCVLVYRVYWVLRVHRVNKY